MNIISVSFFLGSVVSCQFSSKSFPSSFFIAFAFKMNRIGVHRHLLYHAGHSFCSKPTGFESVRIPKLSTAKPLDSLGYELFDSQGTERKAVQRSVIDSFGLNSFKISGVRVSRPVLVMTFFSTLWNVHEFKEITPSSFALLKLIVPRPDITIIGTGSRLLVCIFTSF